MTGAVGDGASGDEVSGGSGDGVDISGVCPESIVGGDVGDGETGTGVEADAIHPLKIRAKRPHANNRLKRIDYLLSVYGYCIDKVGSRFLTFILFLVG